TLLFRSGTCLVKCVLGLNVRAPFVGNVIQSQRNSRRRNPWKIVATVLIFGSDKITAGDKEESTFRKFCHLSTVGNIKTVEECIHLLIVKLRNSARCSTSWHQRNIVFKVLGVDTGG